MTELEKVPHQARFDMGGGVLKTCRPCPVTKAGEPVRLYTNLKNLSTEIEIELGRLQDLGARGDAGADTLAPYSKLAEEIKEKLKLRGELYSK